MQEDEKFVRKDDCAKHVVEIENKLQMILNALRGPDLRGGLVKDVNKIFTEVALLKNRMGDVDWDEFQTELALLKKAVANGKNHIDKEEAAEIRRKEWSRKQWLAILAAVFSGIFSIISNLITLVLG